jgi:hypothetical protein
MKYMYGNWSPAGAGYRSQVVPILPPLLFRAPALFVFRVPLFPCVCVPAILLFPFFSAFFLICVCAFPLKIARRAANHLNPYTTSSVWSSF